MPSLIETGGVIISALLILGSVFTIICRDASHFHGLDKELDASLIGAFFQRMYFLMTTLTTIGYGDIAPRSVRAKILVMAVIFIIVAVILKALDNFVVFVKQNIIEKSKSLVQRGSKDNNNSQQHDEQTE